MGLALRSWRWRSPASTSETQLLLLTGYRVPSKRLVSWCRREYLKRPIGRATRTRPARTYHRRFPPWNIQRCQAIPPRAWLGARALGLWKLRRWKPAPWALQLLRPLAHTSDDAGRHRFLARRWGQWRSRARTC